MPETFPKKIEMAGEPIEKKGEEEPSRVEEFFDNEAEILGVYGFKGDIALERGDKGWMFDFENKKLVYDPSFFIERGYNLKETLFATTHELMAHYGELLRDPELVLKEAKRYSQKEHLHLLYNIFEDVLGNRRIVSELPFLEETRTALYKEKLFPKADYQDSASHVQFVYGFIREAMVPGESVKLLPEAREALEKLRGFGAEKINILDLVTTPTIEPKDRFRLMRQVIEPVYLELYKNDLERETEKQKKAAKPTEGKELAKKGVVERIKEKFGLGARKVAGEESKEERGKGWGEKEARGAAEKSFKEQYKNYNESHPEPLSKKDEEKIKETLQEIVSRRGGQPSLDQSILEQWAREQGLNPEDVIGYRQEYQEIAPLVAELREVFKKIVSRRLQERWKFAPQLKKEGEELEESVLAEAYVESKVGGEPPAFREIERKKREREGYGMLDMTLINDLSGSMGERSKLDMDRKSKLLFLESLADFQKEIKEAELESGISLGLEVRTETRAFGDFGDAELKSLSPELSEKERIAIWKKLHKTGGGTPDYLSLEAVLESITPEYEKELKEKLRRKVVMILSDGESENSSRVQRALQELRRKGVVTLGLGMTESGAAVKETYKPDAEVIEDIRQLPAAVQKVILKYTQDL